MKKVSVIVPVYNVEKYLDMCIESLVNQTLDEIEIILVDDCSLDDSYKIMEKWYAMYPEKIRLIKSVENRRQGGARNLGMEVAKGEYIAFVDSDDWIVADALELMYNKTLGNKVDIVYNTQNFRAVKRNDSFEIITETVATQIIEGSVTDEVRKKFLITCISVWNCLYKRSFIEENNLKFAEKLAYEDNLWCFSIVLLMKTIAGIERPLYYYRFVETSTVNVFNRPFHLHYEIIVREIIKLITERLDQEIFKAEIEYLHIYFIYIMFKNRARKFKPIKYDWIKTGKELKKTYPDFENNRYYIEKFSKKRRKQYKFLDKHPRFAIWIMKILNKGFN